MPRVSLNPPAKAGTSCGKTTGNIHPNITNMPHQQQQGLAGNFSAPVYAKQLANTTKHRISVTGNIVDIISAANVTPAAGVLVTAAA